MMKHLLWQMFARKRKICMDCRHTTYSPVVIHLRIGLIDHWKEEHCPDCGSVLLTAV